MFSTIPRTTDAELRAGAGALNHEVRLLEFDDQRDPPEFALRGATLGKRQSKDIVCAIRDPPQIQPAIARLAVRRP